MIAACCRVFGDTAFAVRLPVAICSAAAALGVALLTRNIAHRDTRAAFLGVLCFLLSPAFQANAQLSTQDGPLILCWVMLTAAGLRLMRRWSRGASTWGEWALVGLLMGVGCLVKQSMLLFAPSFAIFGAMEWRRLQWRPRVMLEVLSSVALFSVVISPMVLWNAQHGWPTLAHTLGHAGFGGDQLGHVQNGNPAVWMLSTIGGILGAMGPTFVGLAIWASLRVMRLRRIDPAASFDRVWILCAAWPSIAFYVGLSLFKPVIASWPLPSFVPLVVLVAELASSKLREYDVAIAGWRPVARMNARPTDALFRRLWNGLLIYGLIGWAVIMFPLPLAHLPIVGERLENSVIERFTGHRQAAMDLQRALASVTTPDGRPPLIVAQHYMAASLYSFYLPDHPVVFDADTFLGKRSTTFDIWPDTDLRNSQLRGRTLLLDGQDVPWRTALVFATKLPIDGRRYWLAIDYQGPRADHPRNVDRAPAQSRDETVEG
jgi:4-amino-4-deoxy-L-arabinose transferase-like glycosyltransferase